MNIAFLDFDGTITVKDSLANFIQYAIGKPAFYMGLLKLSPMLTTYTFKLIPNHIAKEKLIAYFFKGWDAEHFRKLAEQYSLDEIGNITRPKAIEKITWHQDQGHKVVIVSASVESWLKKWCQKYNIDLIATRLEIQNGKITGRFATRNCYGIEKVKRIKDAYDLSQFDYIYAYGDSRGDKEMLSIANESYYKHFD